MTPQAYISTILPRMEGWCSHEKATCLASLVASHTPCTFVEIGVFAGRSLFAAALANPSGLNIGIDPWENAASIKGFTDENAKWWGALDHDKIYAMCRATQRQTGAAAHLLRCTSAEALALVARLAPIDILHIDGNHSEESALYDVEHYVPLVPSGGTVLFDDTDWLTTKRAQSRLAELCDTLEMVGTCGIYRRRLTAAC